LALENQSTLEVAQTSGEKERERAERRKRKSETGKK